MVKCLTSKARVKLKNTDLADIGMATYVSNCDPYLARAKTCDGKLDTTTRGKTLPENELKRNSLKGEFK